MMRFTWAAALCAGLACAQDPYTKAQDANDHILPVYSPARPPAIPLAVRSPYTNAWSSTAKNGTLNSVEPIFWPGNALGWEGMVRVDGVSYEYLGTGSQGLPTLPNLKTATPLAVSYDSQYSNFTFQAGPLELNARFLSPVIPKDLCRTSIPLSYLVVDWRATDGVAHDVQFYSDVNGGWISYETNKTLNWTLYEGSMSVNGSGNGTGGASSVYSWLVEFEQPYEFGELYDFPEWGNFSYTSSRGQAQNLSFQRSSSANARYQFVMNGGLSDTVDPNYRGSGDREPVFAFAHDFGSGTSGSTLYTIGTIQQPVIRYLTCGGVLPLQPWWTKCYGDIFSMISFHYNDFATSAVLGMQFEVQLKADVDAYYAANMTMVWSNSTPSPPPSWTNGTMGMPEYDQFGQQYIFDPDNAYGFLEPNGTCFLNGVPIPDVSEAEAYYSIVTLSARQVMGAYVLTVPPATECGCTPINQDEPLMFQKEISSDGNVNTVDVMYPAMPFFLYANPELLRYNLNPLFQNQEGGFYPNGYSMHDLGTHFPNATGHVEGNDEYMPVEESGNMVLMTYAYYKFTGNSAYLQQHYQKLAQFAQYLIEYSLIPGIQLSTDDFADRLINQTNLAIKGIVALEAMSGVARVVGASADAANFSAAASLYYNQWEYFAIDPSRHHTLLAYEWRSSYGLLYNTYPDKLLNLGIIPQSLYQMQSDWYPQVSQIFGVPLDNRHSYTKSDWEMWTAATCAPETRRLFVNTLAYWLNNTSTDRPFTDLYETIDEGSYPVSPEPIHFIARPVAGGHFSLLAMLRAGGNALTGTGPEPGFAVNSTDALTADLAPSGVAKRDYRTAPVRLGVCNRFEADF